MKTLREGARIESWVVSAFLRDGEGYQDVRVAHEFLGTEAEMRVFGPEFLQPSEVKAALEFYLFAFAHTAHPGLLPTFDCGDLSKEGEASYYIVRGLPPTPSLQERVRQSPLDTRERILPFLQAAAALIVDFQGIRFSMDRMTLEDCAWDGHCLTTTRVAWGTFFDGSARRRLPALAPVWERDFPNGIYPLGEKTFPRIGSLVRLGHLAYEAAGILNPDKRILETSKVSAAETSSVAPPLVEGWGLAVEAFVRRCLFAHQAGMMDKPDTALDLVEKLLRGEIPEVCRYLPSLTAGTTPGRGPDRPVTAEPVPTTPRAEREESIPVAAGAAPRTFTPLGAEAALLDTPAKHAAARKPAPPPVRVPLPTGTIVTWVKIAGMVLVAALAVILVVTLLRGKEKPNTAPTAVIGPTPATVQQLQTVQLDATQSRDPEGDPLTYIWSVPALSVVDYQLEPNNSRAAAKATLRFFKRGTYEVVLQIFDGHQYSAPQRITIHVER